jgi:Fic family protein
VNKAFNHIIPLLLLKKDMSQYIHQLNDWANFKWNNDILLPILSQVRHKQGVLMGKMLSLGFDLKQEAFLETLTLDVLKTSEIEGEFLQPEQVRSSIARHLGMDIHGLIPSDRHVEGVVQLMLDATQKADTPLSISRLFDWHAALFPTGRSGMYKITVGDWRKGSMQVVSGGFGNERVHFQAPEAPFLAKEMADFIAFFNKNNGLDPVLKAGIAHLWFITIHPFDDGNGRIARAIADMQLAKAENSTQRFYSMSAQIQIKRNAYYRILEQTQKGNLDITDWLTWFLKCLDEAIDATSEILERTLKKAHFWEKHAKTVLNERQVMILNRFLGDFEGKLTTSKWSKMAKCSTDTALRDIQDLVTKNILIKENSGGRSTSYILE